MHTTLIFGTNCVKRDGTRNECFPFFTFVPRVQLVCPLLGISLVHNVCHEIVLAAVRILGLEPGRQQLAKLDRLYGEVYDGRVLLHVEGVFGEALDVEDDVGREARDLKLLQEVVLVRLVLLLGLAVELGQDVVQTHLAEKEINCSRLY